MEIANDILHKTFSMFAQAAVDRARVARLE